MFGAFEILENGLAGAALSLAGTYLVAMRKGAERLDHEQQAIIQINETQIASQAANIAQLNQSLSKPQRTSVEEHHYQVAKAILAKHGESARSILRHLRTLGELQIAPWFVTPLPEGIPTREHLVRVLDGLSSEHVVNVEHTITPGLELAVDVWRISSGFAAALDELLYAESGSDSSQT
jgi:hypothetical protein